MLLPDLAGSKAGLHLQSRGWRWEKLIVRFVRARMVALHIRFCSVFRARAAARSLILGVAGMVVGKWRRACCGRDIYRHELTALCAQICQRLFHGSLSILAHGQAPGLDLGRASRHPDRITSGRALGPQRRSAWHSLGADLLELSCDRVSRCRCGWARG